MNRRELNRYARFLVGQCYLRGHVNEWTQELRDAGWSDYDVEALEQACEDRAYDLVRQGVNPSSRIVVPDASIGAISATQLPPGHVWVVTPHGTRAHVAHEEAAVAYCGVSDDGEGAPFPCEEPLTICRRCLKSMARRSFELRPLGSLQES